MKKHGGKQDSIFIMEFITDLEKAYVLRYSDSSRRSPEAQE